MADEGRLDRGHDPRLATLLAVPDPPTRDEYADKKLLLAKKMDRLEGISKARMWAIKNLHQNNEKKAKCITCYGNRRLLEACNEGLREAEQIFDRVKQKHSDIKSVDRRLKIVHKHCTHLEIQTSKVAITENELEPCPTKGLFPNLDFEPFIPSYRDMLNNAPSPFKEKADTRDPLMSVTLLQPYKPPPQVLRKMRERKARAVRQIEESRHQQKKTLQE